jgi:hypothetical protein
MVSGMSSPGDDPTAPGDPQGGSRLEALGNLPASRQDRDRVVGMLRVAAGDGRLTAAELDARLEAALAARTYAELAALTADLPAAASPVPAAPSAKPPAAPVPARPRRRRLRRWLTRCRAAGSGPGR